MNIIFGVIAIASFTAMVVLTPKAKHYYTVVHEYQLKDSDGKVLYQSIGRPPIVQGDVTFLETDTRTH
jgi:hypothetical protein